MSKQEMSCPHSERITYCEDCMLRLYHPELFETPQAAPEGGKDE